MLPPVITAAAASLTRARVSPGVSSGGHTRAARSRRSGVVAGEKADGPGRAARRNRRCPRGAHRPVRTCGCAAAGRWVAHEHDPTAGTSAHRRRAGGRDAPPGQDITRAWRHRQKPFTHTQHPQRVIEVAPAWSTESSPGAAAAGRALRLCGGTVHHAWVDACHTHSPPRTHPRCIEAAPATLR